MSLNTGNAILSNAITVDGSYRVGIGITPSSWSGFNTLQVSALGLWSTSANNSHFSSNLYYDGTDRRYISSDYALEYNQQSGIHKWLYAASGTAGAVATLTEAMRITTLGQLLVGTTTSIWGNGTTRGVVEINGTTQSILGFDVGGSGAGYIYHDGTNMTVNNGLAGYLALRTNSTTRITILSSGEVGIGTSSPTYRLSVVNDSSDWIGQYKNYGSAAYGLQIDLSGSTGGSLGFVIGAYSQTGTGFFLRNNGCITIGSTTNYSQYKLVITSTGTTNATAAFRCEDSATYGLFEVLSDGAIKFGGRTNSPYNYAVTGSIKAAYIDSNGGFGYNSSTRESKTNIVAMNSVSWLNELNPVTFNKREKDNDGNYTDEFYNELHYGLIAEEVEAINPDFVFYEEKDGEKKLAGIHYDRLVTPILKLVQELNQKVTDQQQQINQLINK